MRAAALDMQGQVINDSVSQTYLASITPFGCPIARNPEVNNLVCDDNLASENSIRLRWTGDFVTSRYTIRNQNGQTQ
jgi:hypothetical protein